MDKTESCKTANLETRIGVAAKQEENERTSSPEKRSEEKEKEGTRKRLNQAEDGQREERQRGVGEDKKGAAPDKACESKEVNDNNAEALAEAKDRKRHKIARN